MPFDSANHTQPASPPLTSYERAQAEVARRIDPKRHPELYASAVRVEHGFIVNREGNERADRCLKACGDDRLAALKMALGEVR